MGAPGLDSETGDSKNPNPPPHNPARTPRTRQLATSAAGERQLARTPPTHSANPGRPPQFSLSTPLAPTFLATPSIHEQNFFSQLAD